MVVEGGVKFKKVLNKRVLRHAFWVVALLLLVGCSLCMDSFQEISSYGIVQYKNIQLSLTVKSFPNPSSVGHLISVSGSLVDASGKRQSGFPVTIQYSRDRNSWRDVSTVLTNAAGTYSTDVNFSSSGSYHIKAMCGKEISFCRHVVADFFVAGDGSEDFVDIQMAIDALPSEAGVVYIKSGLYDLNPEMRIPYKSIVVRSNLILIGEGIDRTVIRQFHIKQPAGSDVREDVITSVNDVENLVIENLTLVQNGTPDNQGFSAFYLRQGNHENITLRNIKVTDAFGAGIAIPRAVNVLIEGCVVDRVWTGIVVAECIGVQIRQNSVSNTSGDGIYPQRTCSDITIEDNYIENCGDTGLDLSVLLGLPPHERIVARNNTLRNAQGEDFSSVRISNAIDIQFVNNTIENGCIRVDAGAGRPINITVEGNKIASPCREGIGFYGALDAFCRNNRIEMLTPAEGVVQRGIVICIWGTGLIENNTILNSANYGIGFEDWTLGSGINITIRRNRLGEFADVGIYDDGKHQGPKVDIIENDVFSNVQSARWGVLTDFETNTWLIERNTVEVGELTGNDAINAPGSTVGDNK